MRWADLLGKKSGLISLYVLLGLFSSCLANVELEGLSAALTTQVLSDLSIAQTHEMALSPTALEAEHQHAKAEILSTLQSLGYYGATVTEAQLSILNNYDDDTEAFESGSLTPQDWLATYRVTLGKPIQVDSTEIHLIGAGKTHPVLETIVSQVPFKSGDILIHKTYENYKKKLLSRALQFGYLDAVIVHSEIAIDREKREADITLVVDTGNPYYLGEIGFIDPPYPRDFLKRFILLSPGETYTTAKLLQLHQAFGESNLFKKIEIIPLLDQRIDREIPINIRLESKPQNSYHASLGYGTDTGPRGRLGWERRRQNFPGHRILVETQLSEVLRQVGAQYFIPGQHPNTDQFVLGIQWAKEIILPDQYSKRYDFSLQDIRRRDQFEFIMGIQFSGENFRDIPDEPEKRSHLLLPSMSVIWNNAKREQEKNSERQYGLKLQGTVRGALGLLLSSTNILQWELKAKSIHLLGDNSRILLRADIGGTVSETFEDIPLSMRFFAGGDNTVRGYAYKSLGPIQTDPSGNQVVVGGRYLTVFSGEIETRLYDKLFGAVFMDAGNAMNRWKGPLYLSAGLGIRYATPIGLLRLDVAKPIREGKNPLRLHISFGMDL
jgi:translocation and assembly module TamA